MSHTSQNYTGLEVAVIGMSGRFPGADSISELWKVLTVGKETISFFSHEELIKHGVDAHQAKQSNYVGARGVLNNVEMFDAGFFGFSAREAELLDPQVRIFFECVYEAMEDAGYNPFKHPGKIGLFAGANPNLYWSLGSYLTGKEDIGDFANKDLLSTRVSYKLNLRGPSHTLFTACSTSLVSVHQACRSLLGGECDMAIAGGISIELPQVNGYEHQEGMILSLDGHNRSFDKNASGTVFGNGAGTVVLKLLEDAIRDNDHIYAVVKGTAVNNDGNRKVSFPAPSVSGQAEVIREAMQIAQVSPDQISYIEAHGSATSIGDPIEVEALHQALKSNASFSCGIGSVKSNVGHLNIASGITGFIKTVLSLHHGVIPPSIHFSEANGKIDFSQGPLYVVQKLTPWIRSGKARIAGVSSFGVGGTNAHAVLQEAPEKKEKPVTLRPMLILWSARSEASLEAYRVKLGAFAKENVNVPVSDVAYTLQAGRHGFSHRAYFTATDRETVVSTLTQQIQEIKANVFDENQKQQVILMFSGQGAQYHNMARGLYENIPAIREDVDKGLQILSEYFKEDLRAVLLPAKAAPVEDRIHDTQYTQPLLFIIEYALARFIQRIGIRPVAMIGHSLGEYVAACVAGVMSMEDALKLVARRGQLTATRPRGAMLSVAISEKTLLTMLPGNLSLAAVNSPGACVVSGESGDVLEFQRDMEAKGYTCKTLNTSHAFHSRMLDGMLEEFRQAVSEIQLHAPSIPYVSNLTGTFVTPEQVRNPEYWVSHLRHTVRFAEGVFELSKIRGAIWVEAGPGNILTNLVGRSLADTKPVTINLLRHQHDVQHDEAHLLDKLGMLWSNGCEIDWDAYYSPEKKQRVSLPTYAFDRKSYWFNESKFRQKVALLTNGTETMAPVQHGLCQAMWTPKPLTARMQQPEPETRCILFTGVDGIGQSLRIEIFGRYAHPVILVRIGHAFTRITPTEFEINPVSRICLEDVLNALPEIKNGNLDLIFCNAFSDERFKVSDPTSKIFEQAAKTYGAAYTNIVEVFGKACSQHPVNVFSIERINAESVLYYRPEHLNIFLERINAGISEKLKNTSFKRVAIALPDRFISENLYWKGIRQLSLELASGPSSDSVLLTGHQRMVYTTNMISAKDHHVRQDHPERVALIGNGHEKITAFANVLSGKGARVDVLNREPVGEFASEESIGLKNIPLAEAIKTTHITSVPVHYNNGLTILSEKLSAALVCVYLQSENVALAQGNTVRYPELVQQLGVKPAFRRFFDYMLHLLRDEGIIEVSGEDIRIVRNVDGPLDLDDIRTLIEGSYPQGVALYELARHCAAHYAAVLRGEISGVSVLFPEGSTRLLDSVAESQSIASSVGYYAEKVKELVLHYASRSDVAPVRILEVGAGRGELTKMLLPALNNANVQYVFSDIGHTFLREGKSRFGNYGFVSFKHFDIGKDPLAQGFEPQAFDIVLALDVIHATPSISQTIANLHKLLKPGGWLLAIENTSSLRLSNLIWGLTDGWWQFQDTDVRKFTPLMSGRRWQQLLGELAFEFSDVISGASTEDVDHSLIVAQSKVNPVKVMSPSNRVVIRSIAGIDNLARALGENVRERGRLHQAIYFRDHTTSAEQDVHELMVLRDMAIDRQVDQCIVVSRPHSITGQSSWEQGIAEFRLDALLHALNNTTQTEWVHVRGDFDAMTADHFLGTFEEVLSVSSGGAGDWFVALGSEEKEQVELQPDRKPAVAAGQTDTVEQRLCAIWNEIFGIDHVKRTDNYFELGGDSLMVVELLTKINKWFGVRIRINEFYQHATVAQLAAYISEKKKDHVFRIQRAEKKKFYPTTSSQKTMYYLQLLHPENTAYNITKIIELQPSADQARLSECFNRIIQRQENLRTVFRIVAGEPCQIILPHVVLKATTIATTEKNLARAVESFIRPFNLDESPALRLAFIATEKSKYMLLDIHHIICDAVAIDIIKKELAALYAGETPEPLALQYKDFAEWRTRSAFKNYLREQEKYWLEVFHEPVTPLSIPADFTMDAYESHRGDHFVHVLDGELAQRLYAITRSGQGTLFSQLLAAAYVVLGRYTEAEDLVIGTGTAGRNFDDLGGIIGNFVNTVAIRCFPRRQKTYSRFLEEVNDAVTAALEHDDYQYEELIARLPYNQGKKDKALFRVAVTLFSESLIDQHTESDRPLFKRYVDLFDKTSKFDIDINAVEKEGKITLVIEYSASLYKAETIKTFVACYCRVLDQATQNLAIRLDEIMLHHVQPVNAVESIALEEGD